MKDLKILRKLLVVILSMVFILTFSKITLAADTSDDEEDDIFADIQSELDEETDEEDTDAIDSGEEDSFISPSNITDNTATEELESNTLNLSTNSTNNSTNNTTYNRGVSNTNSLANTGLSDTNGGVALIVIICVVSAIYSYKKFNDYRKI